MFTNTITSLTISLFTMRSHLYTYKMRMIAHLVFRTLVVYSGKATRICDDLKLYKTHIHTSTYVESCVEK